MLIQRLEHTSDTGLGLYAGRAMQIHSEHFVITHADGGCGNQQVDGLPGFAMQSIFQPASLFPT